MVEVVGVLAAAQEVVGVWDDSPWLGVGGREGVVGAVGEGDGQGEAEAAPGGE